MGLWLQLLLIKSKLPNNSFLILDIFYLRGKTKIRFSQPDLKGTLYFDSIKNICEPNVKILVKRINNWI